MNDALQTELARGDALAKEGQPREAEACYTRAIELDPEGLKPHFRRANLRLFELDDAAGALDDLRFVRDQGEGRPDAVDPAKLEHLLGEALFQLSRYDEAVDHFEDALALGHDAAVWAEQHLRLAECWEHLGNGGAMAASLQAFLDLAPRTHLRAQDVAWAQTELARLRAEMGT